MVKYDVNWEIMNTYENLQIVQSQFFTHMLIFVNLGLIWISIGLSVLGFVANEYKQRAMSLHLTICNIRSAIRWAITKVILNYSLLPSSDPKLSSKETAQALLELPLIEYFIYWLLLIIKWATAHDEEKIGAFSKHFIFFATYEWTQ